MNFIDRFSSFSVEDFQSELLYFNGFCCINGVIFKCISTVVNILPTCHAYHLLDQQSSEEFVLVSSAELIGLFRLPVGEFVISEKCPNYLLQNNAFEEHIPFIDLLQRRLHDIFISCAISFSDVFDYSDSSITSSTPVILSSTQSHMAHYLWNHLSAFYKISQRLGVDINRFPVFCVKGSEKFCPLSELFGTSARNTFVFDHNLYKNFVYTKTVVVEPYGNDVIPLSLRNKILGYHSNLSVLPEQLKDGFNICISLRSNDRKLANRGDFYQALVDHISRLKAYYHVNFNLIWYESSDFESTALSTNNDILSPMSFDDLSAKYDIPPGFCDLFSDVYILSDTPFSYNLNLLSSCRFALVEWGASLSILTWILGLPSIQLTPEGMYSVLNNDLNQGRIRSYPHTMGVYNSENIHSNTLYPLTYAKATELHSSPTLKVDTSDYYVNLDSLSASLRLMFNWCL